MDFVLREPCVDHQGGSRPVPGPKSDSDGGAQGLTLPSHLTTFNALMILSYVENVMLAAGTRHFYTIKHAENGSS